MNALENITEQDVINYGKQLENVDTKNPVLWHDILNNGNCFFHALHYALTNDLSIEPNERQTLDNILLAMRKKYARLVIENEVYYYGGFAHFNKHKKDEIVHTILTDPNSRYTTSEGLPKISEVKPVDFLRPIGSNSWQFAQTDIIRAAAVDLNKVIVIISRSDTGGITIIKPNSLQITQITKDNVVFLICIETIHYVPFKFNPNTPKLKVKMSEEMLIKLKFLLSNLDRVEYDDRSSLFSCMSTALFVKKPQIKRNGNKISENNYKGKPKQIENNAKLARKLQNAENAKLEKLEKKRKKHVEPTKKHKIKHINNNTKNTKNTKKRKIKHINIESNVNLEIARQFKTNAKLARELQNEEIARAHQIETNAKLARELQNEELARKLQIQNNAEYARYLQYH